MTVQELIDYLTEFCDRDAEVKIASGNVLFGAEIMLNSALNVILVRKDDDDDVNCVVCGEPAVAAPYANQLICYYHWSHFEKGA